MQNKCMRKTELLHEACSQFPSNQSKGTKSSLINWWQMPFCMCIFQIAIIFNVIICIKYLDGNIAAEKHDQNPHLDVALHIPLKKNHECMCFNEKRLGFQNTKSFSKTNTGELYGLIALFLQQPLSKRVAFISQKR